MNRIATLNIKGEKYSYDFGVYDMNQAFDHSSGIYALTNRDASGSHKVLYVGQTNDLADRMANHEKMDCAKNRGMNRICFLEENSQTKRDEYEGDLIKRQQPPCNELLK